MDYQTKSEALTKDDIKQLFTTIAKELRQNPPVIGVIGVSGVGKSSTINTLFKTNLATSDTIACTKEFWATDVKAQYTEGNQTKTAKLRVIDAPGLGEDIQRDPEYLEMYQQHLPECDVILWIFAARNRAVALDQQYLKKLSDSHNKMVFGLNQVDFVEPVNWDMKINLPSRQQEKNIEIIVKDRREKIQHILQRDVKLIPYSAKTRYNLQELFSEIINSCPPERAWIFNALKGFKFDDFIPEEIRSLVMSEFKRGLKEK